MDTSTSADAAYKNLLLAGINGFSGYEEPALRERSDKFFRTFLIKETRALIKYVNTDFSVQSSDLSERADKLKKGILVLGESLKHPTYQGALFFHKQPINNRLLSRLYECEFTMFNEIENLKKELELLAISASTHDLEDLLIHIQDFIDNFNQHVFERESLILES